MVFFLRKIFNAKVATPVKKKKIFVPKLTVFWAEEGIFEPGK